MAPRGQALPQAATESAREARKSFFCELCQKGYARMNEFEAHEGSYDHQHRKRMKELKQLTKDPNAAAKAREAEARMNEGSGLKSVAIPLAGAGSTGLKKKPVFKSTMKPQDSNAVPALPLDVEMGGKGRGIDHDANGAIANGWANDQYDPEKPTEYDPNFSLADLTREDGRRLQAPASRGPTWQ